MLMHERRKAADSLCMGEPEMPFETIDLTPHLGTKVKIGRADLLSGKYADDIRALLRQRAVLVFPDAPVTDAEQVAFSKTLGNFELEDGYDEVNGSETYRISLDPKESDRAGSLQSSFRWHLDGTTADVPTYASIISCKRVAAEGGQTDFCNTYASYEALPDEDKALIEDLWAHHSGYAMQIGTFLEMSYDRYQRSRTRGADLPMVWRHRDGRKSLVVGSSAEYVIGMTQQDGLGLLYRLAEWATQPRFVYRHEWTPGDIVVWDNTGTLHRALPYTADSGRLLVKTRLAGEETFLGKEVAPEFA
jgi:alpha-ketoglutarate-dependent taurine dioxygenase